MKEAVFPIGEDCILKTDGNEIDITRMDFFDETEDDCWQLFLKYCDRFGIEVEDRDNPDGEIVASIQDYIISIFQDAGIRFTL